MRYHHLLLHARAFGGFLATHDQIGSEMQSIVVGVDGSPASQRATEVGLQLAASLGAHVAFIHFSPLAAKLYQEDPDDGPSQQRLEEADRVLRQAAEAAKAKGVPAELELHESDMIAPELAGAAEGREADFLVVATVAIARSWTLCSGASHTSFYGCQGCRSWLSMPVPARTRAFSSACRYARIGHLGGVFEARRQFDGRLRPSWRTSLPGRGGGKHQDKAPRSWQHGLFLLRTRPTRRARECPGVC